MALDTGLPVTPAPGRITPQGVRIGRFVAGVRVTTEEAICLPADLTKHGLIVGTPGSGKTTLCFSLLTQLWEEQLRALPDGRRQPGCFNPHRLRRAGAT